MKRKSIYFLFAVLLLFSCKTTQNMIDKTVVNQLDIKRYLGTWYEIARYDHRFERGMVGVTANYSMRNDGKIKVLNSGYKNSFDGKFSQAVGKAKIPDPDPWLVKKLQKSMSLTSPRKMLTLFLNKHLSHLENRVE